MFDWREQSHTSMARRALIVFGLGIIVLCAALLSAQGRDIGQWQNQDPAISAWFKRQMQPDNPQVGCCGESDAYEADDFIIDGDKYYAVVTDTRDDAPLGRPHLPVGTRILIPPHKMKRDNSDPNPSGHGLVFVGASGWVYCYFSPNLS